MAAGPEDNDETLARYGLTATQALWRDGFFAGRVHAAHCLDLSAEDIAVFAARPGGVGRLLRQRPGCGRAGEGICPAVDLRAAGVTVALGTDNVAANNCYDMVSGDARGGAGRLAPRRPRRSRCPARDLIRMATIDGARALGLDHETGVAGAGQGRRYRRLRHARAGLFGNAGLRDAADLFRLGPGCAACLGRGRAAGRGPGADAAAL